MTIYDNSHAGAERNDTADKADTPAEYPHEAEETTPPSRLARKRIDQATHILQSNSS